MELGDLGLQVALFAVDPRRGVRHTFRSSKELRLPFEEIVSHAPHVVQVCVLNIVGSSHILPIPKISFLFLMTY